jgi:hypothetical protein
MKLARRIRTLGVLPPVREPLLIAGLIFVGFLVTAALYPPLLLDSYGPRGDGSDPLSPGKPVLVDGRIIWIEQAPPPAPSQPENKTRASTAAR